MTTKTYLITTLESGRNLDYTIAAESKRKAASEFKKTNPGKDIRSVIMLYSTIL